MKIEAGKKYVIDNPRSKINGNLVEIRSVNYDGDIALVSTKINGKNNGFSIRTKFLKEVEFNQNGVNVTNVIFDELEGKYREVKRKAKVGEKIKIVFAVSSSDCYRNGDVFTVKYVKSTGGVYFDAEKAHPCCTENLERGNCFAYLSEYVVLEPIEELKEFGLADLKPCMVVELRTGKLFRVSEAAMGLGIEDGNGQSLYFSSFNNNMIYANSVNRNFDIMRVYGFRSDYMKDASVISKENRPVLWERIEKSPYQIKLEKLEEKQLRLSEEQSKLADEIKKLRGEI